MFNRAFTNGGVDKNKFIVDDTILNHKLINGQTFIDYSLELLEKVNSLNHYNFTLVFFGFFAIEFLLIVVELIALSRIIKTSDSLVRHPIISCSGFLLFDVLYGVIVTLIGKRILENISTILVYLYCQLSLRCLSAVTIVIGFLTLLVWMIESYFKTSVTKIKIYWTIILESAQQSKRLITFRVIMLMVKYRM